MNNINKNSNDQPYRESNSLSQNNYNIQNQNLMNNNNHLRDPSINNY